MSGDAAPLVVVGCGVAGLATALSAAPRPVLLVGRAADGDDGSTALAQGGIAAAMASGDSALAHAWDTQQAGAGYNHPAAVRYLTETAASAIHWLQLQGVGFDTQQGRLQLGHEGGHHCARIVHAGGDASGRVLLHALQDAARRSAHIRWHRPATLEAMLLRRGQVAGVGLRAIGTQTIEHLDCAELVLATGGCGALFAASTNPSGADGNGLALAQAAGATLRDLEFIQFHPTALDVRNDGPLPLITEALRGAGATLVDAAGERIMQGLHPDGELAPRDHVARQVWQHRQAGHQVWLDATSLQGGWLQRFPTVANICRQHGIDPRRQRMPVTPAAHFHMGGIAVDLEGRTSLPGLSAVGEVACNRVHGANRLASNSLLEGVVFGRRLGHRLSRKARSLPAAGPERWVQRSTTADEHALTQLRCLAWQSLGPLRSRHGMHIALQQIQQQPSSETWQCRLIAAMLEAALQRRHSLGAHCLRAD